MADDLTIRDIDQLDDAIRELTANGIDRVLDIQIARELGYRIVAATNGPHIMWSDNDIASWDLPPYCDRLRQALSVARKAMAGER